jgi:hypothetical protein
MGWTEATMNLWFRLMLALVLVCFCWGAVAQEQKTNVQLGVGIICDTAQQVERYLVTISNGTASPQDALQVVNTEARNPNACGMAAIAFIPDEQIGTVNTSNGAVRLMRIRVIAAATEAGWHQLPVKVQYTALVEKFEEA